MFRVVICLISLLAPLAAAPVVERDIRYVERPGSPPAQTSLDLYRAGGPTTTPRPVMVILHGGGWSIGDKANRTFVQPKTDWLLAQGFIVVSVNYRLSPAVRHPAHVEDVCAALAWLRRSLPSRGGDPDRIYLLGHSAGAHLAALAAVDRERLIRAGADPEAIKGVVLLDGAGYDIPRQMPVAARIRWLGRMYRDAFTDDPAVQRDASPALKPIRNPPPFLILHVAAREESAAQSQLLVAALRKAGGTATVTAVPNKTHLTLNADCGKPGDPVTTAMEKFLAGIRPAAKSK